MLSKPSKPKPNRKAGDHAELHFKAIGTHWFIELLDQDDFENDLIIDIQQTIDLFDSHYSRFRSDSFVTRLSRETGSFILPEDAQPMFDLYAELYNITDGKVTPLIGQTISDAGYDADYSLQPNNPQSSPKWADVMDYAFPTLTMLQPALLDFGAAGKGYLVDLVSQVIEKHGISSYLVNGSGDMRMRGDKAMDIGLEHPDQPGSYVGLAHLLNGSLCGSAGNRRTWGKVAESGDPEYHHIMDPTTATSPRHIKAVWVTSGSTILADALTTALYFVPPAMLLQRFDFEYAIIGSDYSLVHSTGFPAEFYVQQE